MVVIYKLTNLGQEIAHSHRATRTSGMLVVYYLARYGMATAEQLYNNISGLTPYRISKLVRNQIIYSNVRPELNA